MEKVSVAPGGRWSRFKTYSTIQRTMEIWGFVLTFIFRVSLDKQKFSYRDLTKLIGELWRSTAIFAELGENFIEVLSVCGSKIDYWTVAVKAWVPRQRQMVQNVMHNGTIYAVQRELTNSKNFYISS